jgi:hypothetical protein
MLGPATVTRASSSTLKVVTMIFKLFLLCPRKEKQFAEVRRPMLVTGSLHSS